MAPGRKKGTPKTGGRLKGTPNKVTFAVREAALQHGPEAVAELARLMKESESEPVRLSACREILDRAYGKARQSVEHTGHDSGPIVVNELSDRERMRRLAFFMVEEFDSSAQYDSGPSAVNELSDREKMRRLALFMAEDSDSGEAIEADVLPKSMYRGEADNAVK